MVAGMTSEVSDPARLFLALWPGPAVRLRLAAVRDAWRFVAGASPVRDERLHMTLHFLGDVPARRVRELQAALQLPHPACELLLDRCDVWKNGCAVLEPSQLPAELGAMHQGLALALQAEGVRVEPRPFRPHVTLARRALQSQPPGAVEPVRWPVRGYVLVRSHLAPPSNYELLARYPGR
jgi:2'-5' RNA ligase